MKGYIMTYWLITVDVINREHPEDMRKMPIESDTSVKDTPYKFRLLDDDGEVYYYGVSSNSSSFAPLDDFGMPNDGCTEIQYKKNGVWETL